MQRIARLESQHHIPKPDQAINSKAADPHPGLETQLEQYLKANTMPPQQLELDKQQLLSQQNRITLLESRIEALMLSKKHSRHDREGHLSSKDILSTRRAALEGLIQEMIESRSSEHRKPRRISRRHHNDRRESFDHEYLDKRSASSSTANSLEYGYRRSRKGFPDTAKPTWNYNANAEAHRSYTEEVNSRAAAALASSNQNAPPRLPRRHGEPQQAEHHSNNVLDSESPKLAERSSTNGGDPQREDFIRAEISQQVKQVEFNIHCFILALTRNSKAFEALKVSDQRQVSDTIAIDTSKSAPAETIASPKPPIQSLESGLQAAENLLKSPQVISGPTSPAAIQSPAELATTLFPYLSPLFPTSHDANVAARTSQYSQYLWSGDISARSELLLRENIKSSHVVYVGNGSSLLVSTAGVYEIDIGIFGRRDAVLSIRVNDVCIYGNLRLGGYQSCSRSTGVLRMQSDHIGLGVRELVKCQNGDGITIEWKGGGWYMEEGEKGDHCSGRRHIKHVDGFVNVRKIT